MERLVEFVRPTENGDVLFLHDFVQVVESIFDRLVSPENLFNAWEEFRKGKGNRADVQRFERFQEENLFLLHRQLLADTYRHGPYVAFTIRDPKQRRIHKAEVRDRVLHHALFRILSPLFEPSFYAHSYSCRIGKGTHRGVTALERMLRRVSKNDTRPCFALKCDIHQFFAMVDHQILLGLLRKRIGDPKLLALLREILGSFHSGQAEKGLPIGNLTSQLFANVYLNELDQFVKHRLRVPHYVRYTDDFLIVASENGGLSAVLLMIRRFLHDNLRLDLHPRKTGIRKFGQGVDFVGYVVFPHHRIVRTRTKRRMFRKLQERIEEYHDGTIPLRSVKQSLHSYLGVLSHANAYRLSQKLRNSYWLGAER